MHAALGAWTELADGVYARPHAAQRLNVGLVVGAERCAVIDTRSSHGQGRDLARAVRAITPKPWVLVNTHAHWDHCFGNAVFTGAPIWGHPACARRLAVDGEAERRAARADALAEGDARLAEEVADVVITPPGRLVAGEAAIDLGGRRLWLAHLGRGHTDGDVVAEVEGVVFAGDLLEEGAPPDFGDAFPLDWPATLEALLPHLGAVVVPGHGGLLRRADAEEQAALHAEVARAAREAHAAALPVDRAAGALPLPREAAEVALRRAWRQLDAEGRA